MMMRHVPPTRLLPLTIAVMAALLAVKSVGLVRAALPVEQPTALVVASAQAADASQAGEKPAEKPAAGGHGGVASSSAAGAPPPPPAEAPIPPSERAVLLELRERRRELDARETALSARESMLAAAEQKLTARVGELVALQKRLESLEAGRTEREEASWQGLVKVYETMKPRDAATIFNDLAQPVLLNVLDRMKDSKAALVLAAMNPDKARDITAQLAQRRTQRNAPLDATASPPSPSPPAAPPAPRPPG
ncbi:MAG: hypothetical protein P4L71_09435 [Acetobacteraceae bacterium]|nr:hypothetical protein [Acetobacteraceae bacterium]